jgi:hypothetical protein
MERDKRGARREEVRIHRYARSTSKLDTTRYNTKRVGEIQKKVVQRYCVVRSFDVIMLEVGTGSGEGH